MNARMLFALVITLVAEIPTLAEPPAYLSSANQVLFLGDSITYAGHFVSDVEIEWRLQHDGAAPEMINLGLPSETCSGLSEPDHPYPRPDVYERLQRALDKARPDVVVACYGMNDGIYYPFDEQRFAAYQDGINRLIEKVQASGARLILMTPPPFDPLPLRKQGKLRSVDAEKFAWFAIYAGYDDVLARYAAWLMEQADRVDLVIDLHTPVNEYVSRRRKSDPDFTFSSDGVHLDAAGHRVLSATILDAWGMGVPRAAPARLAELVRRRERMLHAAWVSHVGHLRPDVAAGLPLDEAEAQAAEIDQQISAFFAE